MIIPAHWAEARLTGKVAGRARVVRRFGWSDESQEAAQQHAEQRAALALAALQQGEHVPGRERQMAYGDDVLPIREEVIAHDGSEVVTRNRYGARCLNVPDVLFADIDLHLVLPPHVKLMCGIATAVIYLAGLSLVVWSITTARTALAWIAGVLTIVLLVAVARMRSRWLESPANLVRCKNELLTWVRAALAPLSEGRFAIYETPFGVRLMALHATFDPNSAAVHALFKMLGTDHRYVRLCRLQGCFRARVSAKPWRIGIREPLRPRSGIAPFPAELQAGRNEWIALYETRAAEFAACRYVEEVGRGPLHARAAAVQKVHDAMCRARSGLPIA
jgi:hypothetical protein